MIFFYVKKCIIFKIKKEIKNLSIILLMKGELIIMNYYKEIKDKLTDVEIQNRIKDYSKNKYTLEKYLEIGKLLIEAQGGEKRAKYGDGLIKEYSNKLSIELGKKFNSTLLKRIRQFYMLIKKGAPLAHQLSWSHYTELLSLKDINAINYYIDKCKQNNLSRNKLRELIKLKEYERIPKNKLNEEIIMNDSVPNPIVINNKNDKEVISEKVLQQLILEDLDNFLKQLGSGFTYIGHEYPIKLGDNYNYIDLLLFNYIYNCFVVIELKVTELKKDHIGQLEIYVNFINKNLKQIDNNETIGLLVTKKNNKYIIEYSTNPNIFYKEYLII